MSFISVCKIGNYKIMVIEDKIIEVLTRTWINNAKKILIRLCLMKYVILIIMQTILMPYLLVG